MSEENDIGAQLEMPFCVNYCYLRESRNACSISAAANASIRRFFPLRVKSISIILPSAAKVLWSLFLGGVFLVIFELLHRDKEDGTDDLAAVSYPQALFIGFFQCLAMIPGVSRSASTIIGGLVAGLKRKVIVEFSFLLAIPTMLAATVLDLYKSAHVFKSGQFVSLGIGFSVSFIVAIIAIKFLLAFIKRHSFVSFGIYRIFIALIFWFIVR